MLINYTTEIFTVNAKQKAEFPTHGLGEAGKKFEMDIEARMPKDDNTENFLIGFDYVEAGIKWDALGFEGKRESRREWAKLRNDDQMVAKLYDIFNTPDKTFAETVEAMNFAVADWITAGGLR